MQAIILHRLGIGRSSGLAHRLGLKCLLNKARQLVTGGERICFLHEGVVHGWSISPRAAMQAFHPVPSPSFSSAGAKLLEAWAARFNPVRESNYPWKLPLSPAKEGIRSSRPEGFTQEAIQVSLEGHHKLSHRLNF